ncbi:hypothetical protein AWB80_08066 [Caballeronia pedi]|uniref:Uncharacterized protein n=1 Tax=Caballeronia pedi TaxID=1777141 RepID=A0A158E391_9BURK|nr:hypothetical protein [Caballeronia pedi]SAL01180.1 hypothetical protein AWB80_08066 [Caballeronia pedi]
MIRLFVQVPRVACDRHDASELARTRRAQVSAMVATIDIWQAYVKKDGLIALLSDQQHRLVSIIGNIRNVTE